MRYVFFMVAALLVFISSTGCEAAKKKEYPSRPIEMVIPFGAGGASDIFARQFADILGDYLGVPVTCINKSASGTVEGMVYAASQPSDGHTILEITPSVLIKDITGEFPFRKYFEPIIKVQDDLIALGVATESEIMTVDDLINYARENPGTLKIGGLSPGGLDDYTAHGFALAAGFEWSYIPYKSGSEIKAAVLGGELDVYQDKLSSFSRLVESGHIRPLVIFNSERIKDPLFAGVPCTVEKGINFTQGSWRGFVIPKKTPEKIKEMLRRKFDEAYGDVRYREFEKKTRTNLSVGYLSAPEYAKLWEEECTGFSEVFKTLGIITSEGKLASRNVKGDLLGEFGFPKFLFFLGIFLLCIMVGQRIFNRKNLKAENTFQNGSFGMRSTIFMMALYIAMMNFLGFTLSTLIFVYGNARLMGYKRQLVLIVFTFVLTIFIVLVFGKVFYVPLPRGTGVLRDLSYYVY